MAKTIKYQESKEASAQIIALKPGQRIGGIPIEKRPYVDSFKSSALKYRFRDRRYKSYIDPANDAQFFVEREEDTVKQTA